MNRREEFLAKVASLVLKDRNASYGDPNANFSDTAAILNVVLADKLSAALTAADVGVIMAGVKLARLRAHYAEDTLLDLAGYAACTYDCLLSRELPITLPTVDAGGELPELPDASLHWTKAAIARYREVSSNLGGGKWITMPSSLFQ